MPQHKTPIKPAPGKKPATAPTKPAKAAKPEVGKTEPTRFGAEPKGAKPKEARFGKTK